MQGPPAIYRQVQEQPLQGAAVPPGVGSMGFHHLHELDPHSREGDDTPLPYSCLDNLIDRGAW